MLRAQKYGLVEMQDRDDIHRDLSTPPRPCSFAGDTAPSYAFPPRQISTADGLQRALDDHPPPPELHTATVWLIRTFPILATVSWLGTLISLFFLWLFSDHKQRYPPSLGGMPYLSDVGARHKTVFFVGNTCTAVCFVVTLFEERLLRARRVMVEATEEKHLWVSIGVLDVFLGLVAGISLVLLAVFDPTGWEKEHCVLFTIFVTCITLSGLLQTLEVEHLWHEHPDRHDLRDGTILKWSFLLFSSACGIAFAILYATCDGDATTEPFEQCYRITTAAALLQWSSALGLSLYFSTLILDLWPLHRHHPSPTPVVWADKTGVRGVWVVHPAGTRNGREAVALLEGIGLHRPPVHRAEMLRGGRGGERKRCAHVLVPHPLFEGRMVPLSSLPGRGKEAGEEEGWAWYSEGKTRGRR